ncbi:MAG: hypothetical protein JWO95_255, partial [Verrucomicrobiales bacterium]|nr:hypothetical protein [Verrucomicrobiales bacterium]
MSIRNLLTIVIVALSMAVTSCSKHSDTRSQTKQTDLGVIQVSNGVTTQHDLGNGQICTITPTISTNGTIVLQMEVKKGGEIISRPRISTTSGVGVGIEIGEVNIALTPVLKQ